MIKSKSEQYLEMKKGITPQATARMANSVSQYRREVLETEIENGQFRGDNVGKNYINNGSERTALGVVSGTGLKKKAGVFDSNSGTGASYRGPGGTTRQTQEVYSPLWLNSNLNLPREKAAINAWCRSFFALNPIVQNAITLHSTYPISKLNIKCKNSEVNDFFENMIDEIDLMNVCVQIAQEYWTLGEAFPYAELSEGSAKWSRISVQNPDFIDVRRSVVAGEPIISLRPDENLRRIITGNRPSDIQQRQQLDKSIIEHVRRGENIPLSNFYVSHIARRISPYEVRGTGLPVSSFRQLMLFDMLRESKFAQASNMVNPLTLIKIGGGSGAEGFKPTPADIDQYREVFECYDDNTEVLTNEGFKLFKDVIDFKEENGKIISSIPKNGIKIGCYNSNNNCLEYLSPEKSYVNNYVGPMYHFHNKKVDIKVSPDHDMWVSEKEYKYNPKRFVWQEFKKIKAKDLNINDYCKLQSVLDWKGESVDSVSVCGKDIPIKLYLEFLGYMLSEGCCYTNNKYQYTIGICQKMDKYYDKMNKCIIKFAEQLNKKCIHDISHSRNFWKGLISGKELYKHFHSEISSNGNTYSYNKIVPKWILSLNKDLLNVLLEAMIDGDGSRYSNENGTWRKTYWTSSKELANNVQEMVLKCGYSSLLGIKNDDRENRRLMYYVQWSNDNAGDYPKIYKHTRNSQTKEKHNTFDIEEYNGKIWCFTVPTGLFITRRNGKITIQGNSAQYDKDFKIFTHDGVTVEKVGSGQGIYDISGDITQLLKEIYIGFMVPSVIMDGGGDITYANGGVSLDVLRQRYMQFRNMLSTWLRRKIFAPISKMNDFYDRSGGQKKLIVPDVEWNHMSLFDMGDYIQNLTQLISQEPRKVSLQTVYRSLGLEYEDEIRKIRRENKELIIQAKEMEALQRMSLNDLRSIGEDDEIQEVIEGPLPGETAYDQPSQAGGGLGGVGGGMDLGLGGGGLGGGLSQPPPLSGGGLGAPPMGGSPIKPPGM